MSDKKVQPDAISPKTGAAKEIGDDAQKNAVERVQNGTPAHALPIIERQEGGEPGQDGRRDAPASGT